MHRCKGGQPVARDKTCWTAAAKCRIRLRVGATFQRRIGSMLFAELLIAGYSVIFSVLMFEMLAVKKRQNSACVPVKTRPRISTYRRVAPFGLTRDGILNPIDHADVAK